MVWTSAYWDVLSNLYWTPRYLGLKSIPRRGWLRDGDRISVPAEAIANRTGPLYTRERKFSELRTYLLTQEEILNHLFNLTFSIASDAVLQELFFKPLAIVEPGEIARLGREIGSRYGWPPGENITQQDGLFVGATAIVGIELKLMSHSWPEQLAKYVALMLWEEEFSGLRDHLALLFLVRDESVAGHWAAMGMSGPSMDENFLKRLNHAKLPRRVQQLFKSKPADTRRVVSRLKLAVLSWSEFAQRLLAVETQLSPRSAGDATLIRLLAGLRYQIGISTGRLSSGGTIDA